MIGRNGGKFMNRVFKVIWSHARNAYVVVSEIALNHGKNSKSSAGAVHLKKALIAALLVSGTFGGTLYGGMDSYALNLGKQVDLGNQATATYDDNGNLTIGKNVKAEGKNNSGSNNTAIGTNTDTTRDDGTGNGQAIDNSSNTKLVDGEGQAHDLNRSTESSGDEDQGSTALGYDSHAEGDASTAIGNKAKVLNKPTTYYADADRNKTTSQDKAAWYADSNGKPTKVPQVFRDTNGNQTSTPQYIHTYTEKDATTGETVTKTEITTDASKADKNDDGSLKYNYKKEDNADKLYSVTLYQPSSNSIAAGSEVEADGENAVAVGYKSTAKSSAVAIGDNAQAEEHTVAIGKLAKASAEGGVALGEGSTANRAGGIAGWDPKTGTSSTDTDSTWKSGSGAISVGSAGSSRQITNVAAGSEDSDAVNVAQLKKAMIHYYSVKTTEDTDKAGNNNYLNDGATGDNALAAGVRARAFGDNSTAVGTDSQAQGQNAAAYGYQAIAFQQDSTAMGSNAQAQAQSSTAYGFSAIAKAVGSTVIGYGSTAQGKNSVAVGGHALADDSVQIGTSSTSQGKWSVAVGGHTEGENSVAVGVGTTAQSKNSVAVGGHALGENSVQVGSGNTAQGKNSVAVGGHALGENTVEVGVGSTAQGKDSVSVGGHSIGEQSTAIGYGSNSTGKSSTAIGGASTNGSDTIAIGSGATAVGSSSISLGNGSNVSGDNSTGVGAGTKASNSGTAVGYNVQAGGKEATAIGVGSKATGENATAIGGGGAWQANSVAIGSGAGTNANAVSIGKDSNAWGVNGVSLGTGSSAGGTNSTAIGGGKAYQEDGIAIGNGAQTNKGIALGKNGAAWGDSAIAIGENTNAWRANSIVLGKNSKSGADKNIQGFDPLTGKASSDSSATWNSTDEAVSIGRAEERDANGNVTKTAITRQLNNVAAGTQDTDAVNVAQLKLATTKINMHYYSVHSTEAGDGSNYANDGASGVNAMAAGPSASAKGDLSVAVGNGAAANGAHSVAVGNGAAANGTDAIALGTNAKADGQGALVVGEHNSATGQNAVAFGGGYGKDEKGNTASAVASVAFGINTVAKAEGTVAFGNSTQAGSDKTDNSGKNYGQDAVAFGRGTKALGGRSLAFGENTVADYNDSVAFGNASKALSTGAVAFGSRTRALAQYSMAFGNRAVSAGNYATAFGTDTLAGVKTDASGAMWLTNGTKIDSNGNVAYTDGSGNTYAVENFQNVKNGQPSGETHSYVVVKGADGKAYIQDYHGDIHAVTLTKQADGTIKAAASTDIARGVTLVTADPTSTNGYDFVDYDNATAFGDSTKAINVNATAFGKNSVASGENSLAFGEGSTAAGNNSVAGLGGTASTANSIALGKGTKANNSTENAVSVAIGENAEASGARSLAIGFGIKDKNDTLLTQTTASGESAVSIGTDTEAAGEHSIAMGSHSEALKDSSVAIGYDTHATEASTVAIGSGTKANRSYGVAIGLSALAGIDESDPASSGASTYDGAQTTAMGYYARATASNATALGAKSTANVDGSVALGYLSATTRAAGNKEDGVVKDAYLKPATVTDDTASTWTSTAGAVSVGNAKKSQTRQVTNVAAGSLDTDAVNVAQLKTAGVTVTSKDNSVGIEKTTDTKDGHTNYDLKVATAALNPEKTGTGDSAVPTGKITVTNPTVSKTENGATTQVENKNAYVTGESVANAINNSGFTLTTSKSDGTVSGTTNELINPGETVTLDAGKNIAITQATNKITVALADDVNAQTVTVTGKDGKDGQIGLTGKDGKDGKVTTIIKTIGKNGTDGKDGKPGVDGTNITRVVYQDGEAGTTTHTFATLDDGLKFGANAAVKKNGANPVSNKLNSTIDIIGTTAKADHEYSADNLTTTVDQDENGKTTITVLMDKDIKGNSLTVGEKGEKGSEGQPGKDGVDGKIGVNGKDGSAVVINGKDGSIGLNGKDGANGLTIKGANGAVGVDGTDGKNGKDGMTRIVYQDANQTDHTVATLDDGLKYAGDNYMAATEKEAEKNAIIKKLNERLDIKGGATGALTDKNIGVNAVDGVLKVQLAQNINLTENGSVTMGKTVVNNDGLKITNDTADETKNVVIHGNEISYGGNQVKNMGSGASSITGEGENKVYKYDVDTNGANIGDVKKIAGNTSTELTTKGLDFVGNNTDVTVHRDLGTKLTIQGEGKKEDANYSGENMKVIGDAKGTLTIMMDKDIKGNSLTVGEKGEKGSEGQPGRDGVDGKIGVNGKDGSAVVINGKDGSIGLNGKDGTNGLTIRGANGAAGVNGKDGKDGMTRIVYQDAKGGDHTVATLEDGQKYHGDFGDVANVALNHQVNIVGDISSYNEDPKNKEHQVKDTDLADGAANVGVVTTKDDQGNATLTIKLNKNLTGLESVTAGGAKLGTHAAGDTSLTVYEIGADGKPVAKNDANGKVVTDKAGTYVTSLTNKTWDGKTYVSGRAATEDQLMQITSSIVNQGATGGFGLSANGQNVKQDLGKTITINGDGTYGTDGKETKAGNISTSVENGAIKVSLNKDLNIDSTTMEKKNTDGSTITNKTTAEGSTITKKDAQGNTTSSTTTNAGSLTITNGSTSTTINENGVSTNKVSVGDKTTIENGSATIGGVTINGNGENDGSDQHTNTPAPSPVFPTRPLIQPIRSSMKTPTGPLRKPS